MKKILGIIIVVLSVLLIYLGLKDDKVYFLSLGDGVSLGTTAYGGVDYGYNDYIKDYLKENGVLETHINQFAKENYRTTDLIRDIENNVTVFVNGKEKTIQNALIKADLITISIGNSDLLMNLELSNDFGIGDLSKRFDSYISDLDKLLKIVRQYSKEKIILTGFYNPTDTDLKVVFDNLNKKVSELCIEYNIIFIDTYSLFENQNYIVNQNSFYPSKTGYKAIADEIISKISPFFTEK